MKMKSILRGLVVLTVFFGICTVQASVTSGTIRVFVKDKKGGPLRGAQITAETVESLTRRTVMTNDAGKAMLLGLDCLRGRLGPPGPTGLSGRLWAS